MSRRRPAGASSPPRSCATGRSARAWSRPSSRPTRTWTSWPWSLERRCPPAAHGDARRGLNNTDRKGGHILPVDGGRQVHGVDHGVCFSTVPKLRTVLWGWRGTPFEPDELEGLDRIRTALGGALGDDAATVALRCGTAGDAPSRRVAPDRWLLPAPIAQLACHPLATVLAATRPTSGRGEAAGSRRDPAA